LKIKKENAKYKSWLKKHIEKKFLKEIKKRRKRKRRKIYALSKKNNKYRKGTSNNTLKLNHQAYAPVDFSIIGNPIETIDFFNNLLYKIRNSKDGIYLALHMAEINNLTIDSVMYLLAVLYNTRLNKPQALEFKVNYPKNIEIRSLLQESGFEKFVNTRTRTTINRKRKNIEIQSGNTIKQEVVKDICDFVNNSFNTSTKYTKFLYNMIIELMTNTVQHAYEDKAFMVNQWYLFVENQGGKIKFIFLDTGSGIPETITRKFLIDILKKDSDYIKSALLGEFRTKTKLTYRGKGLPKVYNYFDDNTIQNLAIVSGKGFCVLDKKVDDIQCKFNGTLFYWELDKKYINEEYFDYDKISNF